MNKFKFTKLLVIGAALFVTEVAIAKQAMTNHFGDNNSCYERQYSQAYLDKYPDQKVTYIRFDHFPTLFGAKKYDSKTGELVFKISVKLSGSNQRYVQAGFCNPQKKLQSCHIECDGGGFNLKSKNSKSILLYNGPNGFVLKGCGYDETKYLTRDTHDKLFLLHRMPQSQCITTRE